MNVIRSNTFSAEKPWDAINITVMNGISCRLHWTNEPYKWHVNDGEEVFAVMSGRVIMHIKNQQGKEEAVTLEAGDIFHAQIGDEHFAEPIGEARILVIESEGSV